MEMGGEPRKKDRRTEYKEGSLQVTEPKVIWASKYLVLFLSLHWLLGSSEICAEVYRTLNHYVH